MTDQAPSTGPRLKAERERRGLSAQKVADQLHLDGWIIDALEAEDYKRIGAPVYAKGHLKRYAALLGLPCAEIVAGYDSGAQSRAQVPAAQALQQPQAGVRLRAEAPAANDLPWGAIAGSAVVVVIAAAVLWLKPWHLKSAPRSAPVAARPDPSPDRASAATDDAVPAAARLAGGAPAMASTRGAPTAATEPLPDSLAGAGRARLRLSFSADSWVEVHDAAGKQVFKGNGRANSVKTIAGIAPMHVYLGFASGVQLEINDRAVAIGPQFLAGDVARFEAGADGVLRRDSERRSARPTG
jgi:cytoskeleton protein RodZ